MSLEAFNLGVGVVMSLAGSVAVAPRALPQLGKIVKDDLETVRRFLGRFLPFLRRTVTIEAHSGAIAMSGVGTVRATGWAMLGSSTLSIVNRIAVLEERANQLYTQLQGLESRLDTTAAELRQSIEVVKAEARQSHAELKARLDMAERQQTEINARAFPLIGFGIVISSLAAPIAKLPDWLDLTIVGIAAIFAFRVIQPIAKPAWVKWQEARRDRGILTWRQRWRALWVLVDRMPVTVPHWLLLFRMMH